MTGPQIRPPPKSLDGRSPRELVSFERVVDDGEEVPPPGRFGGVPDVALPISTGNFGTILLKLPADATNYWPHLPVWFDTRSFNQMRVVSNNNPAGVLGSVVFSECSPTPDDPGSWVEPGTDGSQIAVAIHSTGPEKGGWLPLDPAAIGDRAWRAQARGGDGTLSPVVYNVEFQFRQAAVAAPPNVNVPTFPDPIFWSKSGDLMFTDSAGTTPNPGTNGSNVGNWGDKTPNGWDFVKGVAANFPTLNTSELDPRGLASVEFTGADDEYFTQLSGAVAGLHQCTVFIVKKMKDATPVSTRTGIWHYGRRIGSNDAAHPWTNGQWIESFGQGFHINLGVYGNMNPTDHPPDAWHCWGIRRDSEAGLTGVASHWYGTEEVAVGPVVGGTSVNTWPIEGASLALLGRSLSHPGDFYMTEIILFPGYFTDAQMIAKATELMGG